MRFILLALTLLMAAAAAADEEPQCGSEGSRAGHVMLQHASLAQREHSSVSEGEEVSQEKGQVDQSMASARGTNTAFNASIHVLSGDSYKNVRGGELQHCSGAGMALTGFTRNGQCIDKNDDDGAHHICIDMASNSGGNFCEVTGQPNWCSSNMPCDGDEKKDCPVRHWCVCQWAFSKYLEIAGGCEKIQDIVCDATNMAALRAYQAEAKKGTHGISEALKCLEHRCL